MTSSQKLLLLSKGASGNNLCSFALSKSGLFSHQHRVNQPVNNSQGMPVLSTGTSRSTCGALLARVRQSACC